MGRFFTLDPAVSRTSILTVALGLAAAVSAAAGPIVFLPFAGGNTLRPGEVVEVQWRGTPRGTEEMELLLSLDGGRHFAVRVTPDLDPDRGSYSWRVPPFPSGEARLAIRVNLGGREMLAGRSAPFLIVGDGKARPWSARAHGGDLWVTGFDSDDDGDDEDGPPLTLGSGSAPPRLAATVPGVTPLPSPSPRLTAPRCRGLAPFRADAGPAGGGTRAASCIPATRNAPLRI
jgi:hypothetical protein